MKTCRSLAAWFLLLAALGSHTVRAEVAQGLPMCALHDLQMMGVAPVQQDQYDGTLVWDAVGDSNHVSLLLDPNDFAFIDTAVPEEIAGVGRRPEDLLIYAVNHRQAAAMAALYDPVTARYGIDMVREPDPERHSWDSGDSWQRLIHYLVLAYPSVEAAKHAAAQLSGRPGILYVVDDRMMSFPASPGLQTLSPLFAFYSPGRTDHFYTTASNSGAAALAGTLPPDPPSAGQQSAYDTLGREIAGYPAFPGYEEGLAGATPGAQAWLFGADLNLIDAAAPLLPLYRLRRDCESARSPRCLRNPFHVDHAYASDLNGYQAGDPDSVRTVGYRNHTLECVEGYLYPKSMPRPKGTVRLLQRYNPARDDHAVFPDTELSDMTRRGYTAISGPEWLGYVYPNAGAEPIVDYDPAPPRLELLAGSLGGFGNLDGTGAQARFFGPSGVAAASDGSVYVADHAGVSVRRISPQGTVSTLAGHLNDAGSTDGPGAEARFGAPAGVAMDAAGNVYVADEAGPTIRKITPTGMVSTLAGMPGVAGFQDGVGTSARFRSPSAVAVDGEGNVYVADSGNHAIRKVSPGGTVTTLAGQGSCGAEDGMAAGARFCDPQGIAVDGAGNLYVADYWNHTVRKIDATSMVTTLAGQAGAGFFPVDGVGTGARLTFPAGIAVDADGNVWVADSDLSTTFGYDPPPRRTLRRISPTGVVTTVAGLPHQDGHADGYGAVARFNSPRGLTVDPAGNLFIADRWNQTIRRMAPSGEVTTHAGFAPDLGQVDGKGPLARFHYPSSLAADGQGNVYVADQALRKVSPDGDVATLGSGAGVLAAAPDGRVYVARGNSIAVLDAAGGEAPVATLPAEPYYSASVSAMAVDAGGNVYVMSGYAVRKVAPGGMVTTLAGKLGEAGYVNGAPVQALFGSQVNGMAVDAGGNVYVLDDNTVRKVTPAGMVSTLAGVYGQSGTVDGQGDQARFDRPRGLAMGANGRLYVGDGLGALIREVTLDGQVSTFTGVPGQVGVRLGELPDAIPFVSTLAAYGDGLAIASQGAVLVIRR